MSNISVKWVSVIVLSVALSASAVDAAGRGLVLERMILEGIELPDLVAGRCVRSEEHTSELQSP